MATWGATKAKAQFSAVLDMAEAEGPQLVKRRKQEFYLLTKEQLAERSSARGQRMENLRSMAEFFRSSPLRGSGLQVTRSKSRTREVRF